LAREERLKLHAASDAIASKALTEPPRFGAFSFGHLSRDTKRFTDLCFFNSSHTINNSFTTVFLA